MSTSRPGDLFVVPAGTYTGTTLSTVMRPVHVLPRSDELAYGQVRQIAEGRFLLVLAPRTGHPLDWEVLLLDRDGTEWAWQSGAIQTQTAQWLRQLPLVTP